MAVSARAVVADPTIITPDGVRPPYTVKTHPAWPDKYWLGLILADDLPIFAEAAGDQQVPAEASLKAGKVVWILAKNAIPKRLLVAEFDHKTLEFRKLFGWIEADWVLDNPKPVTVHSAGDYFRSHWPKGSPERAWIDKVLPAVKDGDRQGDIPLKAITHPTRGYYAFYAPVPLESFEKRAAAARPGEGNPIARFAFYYVAKVVIRGHQAFAVLSNNSHFVLYDPGNDHFRRQIAGIVPLEFVTLVPTRMTIVPNYDKEAYLARVSARDPIVMYDSEAQVAAAAAGESADTAGRAVTTIFREPELKDHKLPLPLPDNAVGFPILATRSIVSGEKKLEVYHVAVPARLHNGGEVVVEDLVNEAASAITTDCSRQPCRPERSSSSSLSTRPAA